MACQHQEFRSRLDDAKKLWLYAQSAASNHHTLTASLTKTKASSECWEKEARDGTASVIRAERERDEAKQEARAAQMIVTAAGDAKAMVEVDLTKALNSLATAEEGGCRSEAEITRLEAKFACMEAEREWLLLELEASKREVSSLHARASKDREDMAEDYHGSPNVIFAYGYGCCAFKNNICGDRPNIPDDMPDSSNPLPPKFFDNPRCPPVLATDKAIDAEVGQGGVAGD